MLKGADGFPRAVVVQLKGRETRCLEKGELMTSAQARYEKWQRVIFEDMEKVGPDFISKA